jgi:hypothetical protein
MNQTTEHGPALARALGGYPSLALRLEHLFQMRALPPAVARSGLHVSAFPGRVVLEAAPPIRGGRFSTDLSAGHYAGRDPLCNSTPQRVRSFVKASRMNLALGLF